MLKYVKQATVNGTNVMGVEIPLGGVFGRFAPDLKHKNNLYFYIMPKDLKAWHTNKNSAFAYILTGNMKRFVRQCVSLVSNAWRSIRKWILANALEIDPIIKTGCRSKDVIRQAPKERKVGKYAMRGRPENSSITTDYSVTAGCKIGPRWWNEEGYLSMRMGVHAANYAGV